MAVLERGGDVLFDIDWQGTQQVANAARDDLVTASSCRHRGPPFARLVCAQDSAEVVASRMAKASDEISHYWNMTILSSMMISNGLSIAVNSRCRRPAP